MEVLNPRSLFATEEGLEGRLKASLKSENSYAICMVKDEVPMAVLGATLLFSGVAQLWMVTTDECEKNRFFFCKFVSDYYMKLVVRFNLHRIQFSARSDSEVARRFARFVKFEPEGVMRKYGADKTDYIMYSRLF